MNVSQSDYISMQPNSPNNEFSNQQDASRLSGQNGQMEENGEQSQSDQEEGEDEISEQHVGG